MARLIVMLFLACAAMTSVFAPTPANALDITPNDIQNAALLLGNLTGAFAVFKDIFHKSYGGASEEQKRYMNFAANLINAAGALAAQNPSANFGITPYSDLSESEFAQTFLTSISPFTQEDAEKLCNTSDPDSCDAAVIPVRRGFAANSALATDAHRVAYEDLPEQFRRRKAYRDITDSDIRGDADVNAPPKAGSRSFAGSDDLPLQVDWRTKGAVSPVKYQGECGSCWSFVVTGNVESLWAIAGHPLPDLSEQQLLSCVAANQACNGGIMQYAYDWIVKNNNGYLASSEYYPYVSADEHVPACNNDGAGAAAYINRYVSIPRNEVELQKYIANVGPASIAIEAYGWQHYTGGIITKCNNLMTTHAVVVVGYDLIHDPSYWICKNSWSSAWGEGGYIRIQMWKNVCLIADNPSTGLITSELSEALPTGDPSRRVSKNAAGGVFTGSRALAAVSALVAAGIAMVL